MAHRLADPQKNDLENQKRYGLESRDHGHNMQAHVTISGQIRPDQQMILDLREVRERLDPIFLKLDHHDLNDPKGPLKGKLPSAEQIAAWILTEAQSELSDIVVESVELVEDASFSVIVDRSGRVAASVTVDKLDGTCLSLSQSVNRLPKEGVVFRYEDKEKLRQYPILFPSTQTEAMGFFKDLEASKFSVSSVKWSRGRQHILVDSSGVKIGIRTSLFSTHRLYDPACSDAENKKRFGVCNRHHGHEFRVEYTRRAPERGDDLSVIFGQFEANTSQKLSSYNYQDLTQIAEGFQMRPTCENLSQIIFNTLKNEHGDDWARLRLWETPNNRFVIEEGI